MTSFSTHVLKVPQNTNDLERRNIQLIVRRFKV